MNGSGGRKFVAADVFDAGLVGRVVAEIRPDVIIHQLTDLAGLGNPAAYADVINGVTGVFNIAEHNGEVATDKAVSVLQWNADMRLAERSR